MMWTVSLRQVESPCITLPLTVYRAPLEPSTRVQQTAGTSLSASRIM